MAAGSSDRVSLCALDAPDMHALWIAGGASPSASAR
jgi:hypothetical protein